MKNSDIFHISDQNICFWAELRKIMYIPCKPQFYYIKVGFKGVKIIQACFRDVKHYFLIEWSHWRGGLQPPPHPWIVISTLTMESLLLGFTTNGMTSIFPLLIFHSWAVISLSAPAYGVYVSQLIRYARACSNFQDFMVRGKVLTTRLFSQGYQKTKQFYGRYHELVNPNNVAVSRLFLMFLPMPWVDFQNPWHTLLPTFPSFRPMDMVAKHTYQVMLTIRGRLITTFILEVMSVGLNILIRH